MGKRLTVPNGIISGQSSDLSLHKLGGLYFVTIRLSDAIPHRELHKWQLQREAWLAKCPHPHDVRAEADYARRFLAPIERVIDCGHGLCLLGEERCRRVAHEGLTRLHGRRCTLDAFIVMPNHVHALVLPKAGKTLHEVLDKWKRSTGNEINRILRRDGDVWQHETFVRTVRSDDQLAQFRRYIQSNQKWWRWGAKKW